MQVRWRSRLPNHKQPLPGEINRSWSVVFNQACVCVQWDTAMYAPMETEWRLFIRNKYNAEFIWPDRILVHTPVIIRRTLEVLWFWKFDGLPAKVQLFLFRFGLLMAYNINRNRKPNIAQFLKRRSKAKRRAPAYSRALRKIRGIVQRIVRWRLKSVCQSWEEAD